MSSQGYTEEQAPMVGLTSERNDEEVELETRGPAELQYNDVCGFCGAHIKYPNEKKVLRESKAQCLPGFNQRADKPLTKSQFHELSASEHSVSLRGYARGMVSITHRTSTNPKRSQAEVREAVERLDEKQRQILLKSTDYVAEIAQGISGWYVCADDSAVSQYQWWRQR